MLYISLKFRWHMLTPLLELHCRKANKFGKKAKGASRKKVHLIYGFWTAFWPKSKQILPF